MVLTMCVAMASLNAPALHQAQPEQLSAFAAGLQASGLQFGARVEAVARAGLATPYADGPLGEGPEGLYDTDPLVDFGRVDCVTFVEQTLALAATSSYEEAAGLLQDIRYSDGQIGFETRNHFMVADWAANNGFCQDVTAQLGIATQEVARVIDKAAFFRRVDAAALGQDAEPRLVTLEYLPAAAASKAAKALPSPALVVFIGKVDWLFALHCGLFIREDGGQRLYHASSKAGKVVAADFVDYVSESSRYLGFTVYRLHEPGGSATQGTGAAD